MKTGFIGLGAMGEPMARNLSKSNLLTSVWNRSPDKASTLAGELGCAHAQDPPSMARETDAIVLCVSADADVLDVVSQIAQSGCDDLLVVDCSTVSSATAREAAAILCAANIGFLDCPISGGTEGAVNATLAIMCGGDKNTFELARPVLEAMGKTISHMGPVGAGQATKATNQIMVAGINQAVSESLAFAQSENLPLNEVISTLGGGAAACWFLQNRGPNMIGNKYPLGFKVDLHVKDLEICKSMAATHDARLPVVEMTLDHYRQLLKENHGDEDISSLFRIKAAMFQEINDNTDGQS
jgi:3-hydroxyisobutyrate dehydrogenase